MSKKQSSQRSEPQKLFYTEVFKQKIVNEVVSGKLTQRQAQMPPSFIGYGKARA